MTETDGSRSSMEGNARLVLSSRLGHQRHCIGLCSNSDEALRMTRACPGLRLGMRLEHLKAGAEASVLNYLSI